MEWLQPTATAATALLALVTIAHSTGGLQRRSRLVSKLKSYTDVVDKVPAGDVRDEFEDMIERAAFELVQHEHPQATLGRVRVRAIISAGVGVGVFFYSLAAAVLVDGYLAGDVVAVTFTGVTTASTLHIARDVLVPDRRRFIRTLDARPSAAGARRVRQRLLEREVQAALKDAATQSTSSSN